MGSEDKIQSSITQFYIAYNQTNRFLNHPKIKVILSTEETDKMGAELKKKIENPKFVQSIKQDLEKESKKLTQQSQIDLIALAKKNQIGTPGSVKA